MNTINSMKTALFSCLAVTVLGLALLASGRLIDAADLAVLFFLSGLIAMTVAEYRRSPRTINLRSPRPVRLPVAPAARPARRDPARLAA